jgi:glutamate-1-semialdehyde aminotransferase
MQVKNRNLTRSKSYWERAVKVIMDGTQLYSKGPMVNVQGVAPIYLQRGAGAHVWDVDGNEYIDYTSGVGSIILGYCYPRINQAIARQLADGTNLGLIHPLEVEAAELIVENIPCAEMLRFLKTGSGATTAAVRIARAYTGRDKIIKGEYHGWHDWTMAHTSRNAGIPKVLRDTVFYVEYNNLAQYEALFSEHPEEIAAVITEPVELEPPRLDFLNKLKKLAHAHGALLIFDEVVTGFRFGLGGAQEYFGVTPDLACFGKATSNGMPLSAVVGRAEIFKNVSKKIFMSTTFGGEMLSLAACVANIQELKEMPVIDHIWAVGKRLKDGANELAGSIGVNIECLGYPPRINLVFRDEGGNLSDELKSLFLQEAVKRGVLMGWQMFPTYSHSDEDVSRTLEAFEDAMRICKRAVQENNVAGYLEGELARAVEVL